MTKKVKQITKDPDGTIHIKLTISWEKVKTAYNKALLDSKKTLEVKGFRKGKAPDKIVEEQVGKQSLYTQALQYILPEAYAEKVKQLKLKPIVSPKVEPNSLEEGQTWELTATLAEKPSIKLGDYKKIVIGAKAASKIWTPGKDTDSPKQQDDTVQQKEASLDERLAKIFDELINEVKFDLPKFLIEEQVNRQLSRLLEQIEKLGLSLEQYLISLGKTSDQLRKEYHQEAERTLRLELILNEIANDLKTTVFEEEVDRLIDSVGDEKLKETLKSNAHERDAIRASLRKRKVTDELLKM